MTYRSFSRIAWFSGPILLGVVHLSTAGALPEQWPDNNLPGSARSEPPAPAAPVAPGKPLTEADIEALRARGQAEGWTFTVGHNPATDRSFDELCGVKMPPDWQRPATRNIKLSSNRDLPSAFDWRILRGTTSMKDQGACGSCWAFSAVAPIESVILIKEGIEEDLSEQWLVSCTWAGSCSGGWMDDALDEFLCTAQGAVLEAAFPYEAADVPCGGPYEHPFCIDGYYWVGDDWLSDVPYIKQAILDYGPVSVGVSVDTAFQAYTGGVFNACYSGGVNHAVALVGWDDTQGDGGVWIMKNSWGPDWGEYGYMRIEYACSMIGYATNAVDYVTDDCNRNGTPDTLELSQCAGQAWCADCNANGLLDGCERDCNGNSVADDCDIDDGFSLDVNSDFLPDECETDCNNNGQFDFYELFGNLYADVDRNHVPDECQDCDGDGIWDWDDAGRPDGLLVVSTGKDLVRGFYPRIGAPVGSFGVGHLADPYDVVVGPDRNIYVSSSADNRIVKLDTLGNYLGDLNPCGTYPTGLAFGLDGRLHIASRSTNSVFCYDLTSNTCLGACVASGEGGLSSPYNLTFGSNGHLFVSSSGNNRVIEYQYGGSAWQVLRIFNNAALTGPRGLAFHPGGDLLVASSGNTQILRFTPAGTYVGVFASLSSGAGAVTGLAYGSNGYLYVVSYGGGVVRIYELIGETGRTWRTFNRADPDLVQPAGLTFYPSSDYDCNGNGIPDDCECVSVDPPSVPGGEAGHGNNRYPSVQGMNGGCRTALRVTIVDMPPGFEHFVGETLWAGPLQETCENSAQSAPPAGGCASAPGLPSPATWMSKLQCDPYFANWGAVDAVHLYHEATIPGAAFAVQALDEGCDALAEENYSVALVVATGKWGDIVGTSNALPPNGVVDFNDIASVVDKFKNLAGAPIKARADLAPQVPDRIIDFVDIPSVVDAFRGLPYSYTVPEICP